MAASEKKPGLAVVISAGKSKVDEGDEDESYGASLDELADILGVSDDQREAFSDAFKAAVMSCK